jgi:hypothetical protein
MVPRVLKDGSAWYIELGEVVLQYLKFTFLVRAGRRFFTSSPYSTAFARYRLGVNTLSPFLKSFRLYVLVIDRGELRYGDSKME